MNNPSIEFQDIKEDSDLPEIVRKSFRIPVDDTGKVCVVMNKNRYPVLDICCCGIRVGLDKKSSFSIDETLAHCELIIFNETIKNLNGKVVHFSSDRDGDFQCGIQWTGMEQKTANKIAAIVLKMKEQLLKNDSISFD